MSWIQVARMPPLTFCRWSDVLSGAIDATIEIARSMHRESWLMSWPPPVSAVAVVLVVCGGLICDLRSRRFRTA